MNNALYDAANSVICHIGHQGSIDAQHPAVQQLQAELDALDDCAPTASPPVAPQTAVAPDLETLLGTQVWFDRKDVKRVVTALTLAPAGNASDKTIIMGGKKIREAIDAAMPTNEGPAGEGEIAQVATPLEVLIAMRGEKLEGIGYYDIDAVITAALASREEPAAAGACWRVVPIEPTREMIEAGAAADPERESVWAAYLGAAPQPIVSTKGAEMGEAEALRTALVGSYFEEGKRPVIAFVRENWNYSSDCLNAHLYSSIDVARNAHEASREVPVTPARQVSMGQWFAVAAALAGVQPVVRGEG